MAPKRPPKIRHDNGAGDAPKKKSSKLEATAVELKEARSDRALLQKELEKAQETIRALQNSLSSARSESDEVDSIVFANNLGPCSTNRLARLQNTQTGEMSQFVASMNQMSASSISVPECKPGVDGEDISRLDFEAWQDLLINSMILAGITDEATKLVVFKVKAGQKLLEVYRQTVSTTDAPNEGTHPFSNAMYRLKKHFASVSDVMHQRRRLATMSQGVAESDKAFIQRAVVVAKLCEYPEDKQFDETLSAVAGRALYKEVRAEAIKWMNRKAKNPKQEGFTLQNFIDKVQEIETIRRNEDYVTKKLSESDAVMMSVNAVRAVHGPPQDVANRTVSGPTSYVANRTAAGPARYVANRMTPGYGRTPIQRFNTRGGRNNQAPRGNSWRGSNSLVPERCTRCNSIYHSEENCFATEMYCHNCGGKGHLLRACKFPVAPRNRVTREERKQPAEGAVLAIMEAKSEAPEEDGANAVKSVSDVSS